jgi:hypothetical protein
VSSPHVTAIGDTWVHAPLRGKRQETVGSGAASSLLPFLAGDALQNTQKNNKQLILVFSFLVFQVCFSPFLLFQTCFTTDLFFGFRSLLLCFR